jgi:arginyl-tRNA synthetase
MSKRAGTFVTLRDVVEMVGPDVTRFVMLTRKNDAPLDFDFDKVREQSKDNPVFYVQYAHARISSVLRKAEEAGMDLLHARGPFVHRRSGGIRADRQARRMAAPGGDRGAGP